MSVRKVTPVSWVAGGLSRRPSGDSASGAVTPTSPGLSVTSMNRGGSGLIAPAALSSGSTGSTLLAGLDETKSGNSAPNTPSASGAAAAASTSGAAATKERPKFADLQTVPADEVTVKIVPRKDAHAASKMLSEKAVHRIPHSVHQSLDNFESDWKVVTYPYKPYRAQRVMEHPEAPHQTFNAETEKQAREAAASAAMLASVSGAAHVMSARASMSSSPALAMALASAVSPSAATSNAPPNSPATVVLPTPTSTATAASPSTASAAGATATPASPATATATASGDKPTTATPATPATPATATPASPSVSAAAGLTSPVSTTSVASSTDGAPALLAPPNSPLTPATTPTPTATPAAAASTTPDSKAESKSDSKSDSKDSKDAAAPVSTSGSTPPPAVVADAGPPLNEEQIADPQGWKKKQLNSMIEKGMQPYRLKVLKCYDPTYDWKEGTEVTLCQRKALTPPDAFPPCFRMGVTVSNLVFSFGAVEPFFCELALYDIDTKKKVSESFHFHLNTPATLDLIKGRVLGSDTFATSNTSRERGGSGAARPSVAVNSTADLSAAAAAPAKPAVDSSESKHALFNLSAAKRRSVYLVLLVYKIFQGDIKAIYEAYAKPKLPDKDRAAIVDKIKKACETNYEFRQLFVWSAAPLFDEKDEAFRGDGISFGELYRIPKSDEGFNTPNLCEAIETMSNPKKRSNLKTIPGTCIIKAKLLPEDRSEAITAVGGRIITPHLRIIDPGVSLETTIQLQDEYKKVLERYSAESKAEKEEKEKKKTLNIQKAKEIEAKMREEARAAYKAEQAAEAAAAAAAAGGDKPASSTDAAAAATPDAAAGDKPTTEAGKKPDDAKTSTPTGSLRTLSVNTDKAAAPATATADTPATAASTAEPKSAAPAAADTPSTPASTSVSASGTPAPTLTAAASSTDAAPAAATTSAPATLSPPAALLAPPVGVVLTNTASASAGSETSGSTPTPTAAAAADRSATPLAIVVGATGEQLTLTPDHSPKTGEDGLPIGGDDSHLPPTNISGAAPPKDGDTTPASADANAGSKPATAVDAASPASASTPADGTTGTPRSGAPAGAPDRSDMLKQLHTASQKKLLDKAALESKETDAGKRKFAGVASRRKPVVSTAAGPSGGAIVAARDAHAAIAPTSTEAIREVLEFPRKPTPIPNLAYSNLLYVYPQHVNFGDYRNIAVRMQVRETDSDVEGGNLAAIYHRSDGQGERFLSAVYSSITYHSYTATFSEEWKIELPTYISPRHHLLFTFYNVTAKEGKALKGEAFKKVIGYSFVPLLLDGRILDEAHHLPVLNTINSYYLLSKDEWKFRSKSVFTCTARTVSSLYTNDPHVNKFFTLAQIPLDAQLQQSEDAKKYNKEKADDRAFSHTISRTLKSGQLSRPGAFNTWKAMWYTLSVDQRRMNCYESSTKETIVKWCPITPQTKIAFNDSSSGGDTKTGAGSTASGQWVFTLTNPADSANSAPNGEASLTIMCETADIMNSWLKAIYHMQSSTWSLSQAIIGLARGEREVLIKFMPTIFRLLLALMAVRDDVKYSENAADVKSAAFESLLTVASIVGSDHTNDSGERPKLLDSFVYYLFDHHHISALKDKKVNNPPLRTYEALASLWWTVLKTKKGGDQIVLDRARYSWFLFDLIIKSMLLHMEEAKAADSHLSAEALAKFPSLRRSTNKRDFVSKDIIKLLTNLVTEMSHEIQRLASKQLFGKMLNRNFALFLRDLFYILDRSEVFDLISRYLRTAALEKRTEFLENKFQFLQIICDHEHYVQLNRPMAIGNEARLYLTEKDTKSNVVISSKPSTSPATLSPATRAGHLGRSPSIDVKANVGAAGGADLLFPMRAAANAAASSTSVANVVPNMQIDALGDLKEFYVPQSGHFLPLVLIKEITRSFEHAESDIALARAAFTLKQILTKHEYDARYQDDGRRAAVSMMYIYLLTVLSQNLKNIQSIMSPTAKNDLLAVVLALVRNIPAEFLLQYLTGGDSRIQPNSRGGWFDAFTDLLKEALVCFEYQGGKEGRRAGSGGAEREAQASGRGILSSSAQAALLVDDAPSVMQPNSPPIGLMVNTSSAANLLAAGSSSSNLMSGASASGNSSPAVEVGTPPVTGRGDHGPSGSIDLGSGADTSSPGGASSGAGGIRRAAADPSKGALGALESKYASLLSADESYNPQRRGTATEDPKESGSGGGSALRDKRRVQSRNLASRSLKRGVLVGGVGAALAAQQAAAAGGSPASSTSTPSGGAGAGAGPSGGSPPMGMMTLRKGPNAAATSKDERLARLERAFAGEVAHTVLDFTMQVMIPFVHNTLVNNDAVQDKLLRFLYVFMITNQSDHVLTRLFMYMSQLTTQYSVYLWQHHSRVHDPTRCGKWWYELLRHLTFRESSAREAVEVFTYQWLHTNWEHTGTLTRTRAPLFESFAYMWDRIRTKQLGYTAVADPRNPTSLQEAAVDETCDADYAEVINSLRAALTSLMKSAETDPAREQRGVSAATVQMREIFAHLMAIMDASALIHVEKASDIPPETMCDNICTMIDLWSSESPRMTVRYLKYLYDRHVEQKNFPEAAATQTRLADLIATQMSRTHPYPAPYWTNEHYVSCLKAASMCYEKSEHFELSVSMENRLTAHYQKKSDFTGLLETQKRIVSLYTSITNYLSQGDVRAFGTYYRVGFYGAAFGDYHTREFVYKEPRLTQLGEIHQRLTGFFTALFRTPVGVFKDGNAVDLSKFDAKTETKLQITVLDIYYGNDSAAETERRKTHAGRHFDLGYFSFDTPFTNNPNKAHSANATEQYKRRTILAVVNPAIVLAPGVRRQQFPTHVKRLPVVSRSEVVLTPIEGVIEDIHKRLDRLRKEIEPDVGPPALKTLNQVLSGSVNMQVHGGAEEVCTLFLHPDVVSKFDPVHVRRLRDALAIFLTLCESALRVARSLIEKPADQPLQDVLENGYKNLLSKVSGMVFDTAVASTTATANTTATATSPAAAASTDKPTTDKPAANASAGASAAPEKPVLSFKAPVELPVLTPPSTLSVATTEKAAVSVSVIVTPPTPKDGAAVTTATAATPTAAAVAMAAAAAASITDNAKKA